MTKAKNIIKKTENWLNRHEYTKVALFLFVIVFCCFSIHVFKNGFTLTMNGDYVLQQLHFYVEGYDSFWNFIRTGEFKMWSYEGFLGVNYFAANTFYYLTSPFLLPLMLFPRTLIPQGIYFMYIIKLTTGGLLFYILLHKYHHLSYKVALIGAVAYALSGWGMYYLWFNHFADVLAVFPLTLIGVEHCLQKKQGWLLAIGLFICGITNYYFLFAFAFTTFFYAIFRYFQLFKQNKGSNLRVILMGVAFFAVGIGLSGVVLVTALKVILSTPRVEGSTLLNEFLAFFFNASTTDQSSFLGLGALKGIKEFFQGDNIKSLLKYMFIFNERYMAEPITSTQTFLYPIATFFFPPVSNWDTLVFTNKAFDNTISSIYISAPLFLLFWPALIKTFKTKKIWNIIGLIFMLIIPFVPITYYALNAFSMMYGRWQIFLVAIAIIYTSSMIEKFDDIPKIHIDISFLITITLMISVVAYSFSIGRVSFEYGKGYGIAAQILYVCFVYYYMRERLSGPGVYDKLLTLVTVELLIMGNITTFGQGVTNYYDLYGGQDILKEQQTIINDLKEDDDGFYRIFDSLADRNYNNIAMTLGYKGLSTFHSVYNFELNDFINDLSKVSYSYYNWSMGVDEKRYNLDTFLNVKYYILKNEDINIPLGFSLYKQYSNYTVYINNYFVELGYAFDDIIAENNFNEYWDYHQNEPYYNKYAIIASEDIEEIKDILGDDITVAENNNKLYFKEVGLYNAKYYLQLRGEDTITQIPGVYYASEYLPQTRIGSNNEKNFYGTDNTNGNIGDRIYIDLDENQTLCPNGSAENGCHIIAKLNYGPNIKVKFYHDDTLITEDAHGVSNYDKSGDHKFARGYYVTTEINRIELEFLSDASASTFSKYGFNIYYEEFSEYKQRQEELMANKFENIVVTNNTIKFETNYDDKKMIVLSVPYDSGWSLKVNGENQKIYKVDSGFMGFIAASGKTTYELNYVTPGIKTGVIVSLISLLLFIALILLFNRKKILVNLKNRKKNVHK